MTIEQTLSAVLQTGHISLNVSDVERSKKFYQAVFGFQVIGESLEQGREFVFLGDGQKLVLTLWQQSTGQFETQRPGLHHLSFQVPSVEQVEQAERILRTLGSDFLYDGIVPHAEGANSGGVFFKDPDGIRLEIFSPTGVSNHTAPVAGAPSCGFF